MTEKLRKYAAVIEAVETKTGAKGPFLRINVQGKWYSCFEKKLNPKPQQGEMWAFNIKQAGDFENLIDMIDMVKLPQDQQPTPQSAPPQGAQPPVTHQNVQGGPDRQVSIVRQSSLRSAASCMMLDMTRPMESAKAVLQVAEMFYDWAQR